MYDAAVLEGQNGNSGGMKIPTSGFATTPPITKKVGNDERVGVEPEEAAATDLALATLPRSP